MDQTNNTNADPNTTATAGTPPAVAPHPAGGDSGSSPVLPPATDAGTKPKNPAADAVVDYSKLYPENHGLSTDQLKAQSDFFKAVNLSAEDAKKIIDDKFSAVSEALKKGADSQIEKTKNDWKAAQDSLIQKATEKFGDKLPEVKGLIPTAINRFLPKDEADQFTQFLSESGLINDPRMITMLSAVGKSVSEDNSSNGVTPLPPKGKPTAASFYPNSNLNP